MPHNMPNGIDITDEQVRQVQALVPGQMEYAYRVMRRNRLADDARRHAEALLAEDTNLLLQLNDEDYAAMAERFDEQHDESTDDNSQWDTLVWCYANEKMAKNTAGFVQQYRRICVQRSGYAVVPGNTDDEALENARELTADDFDWEPVTQDLIVHEAEVVETTDVYESPLRKGE